MGARTRAMIIRENGTPEVFEQTQIEVPSPPAGHVLLRQTAVGLNFVDIYHRTGQFGGHDSPPLPAILGVQGAGVVVAVGEDVIELVVDDPVAYVGQIGAYAEYRTIPADRLLRLPPEMSAELAAACLVRGLTAEYLLRRLYKVNRGDTVLIHAVAGGVGRIACQWAKSLGATIIGTVGSEEKAQIAIAHGCDYPIVYTREDFVSRVLEVTSGRGVSVVYDSVGHDTFLRSLDCLRPKGMAINFGTASGQVGVLDLQRLHQKSLMVARPTLTTWVADREDYLNSAAAFFDVIRSGAVRIEVGERYPLWEVARAHSDLEGRRVLGMPVLIP